MMYVGDSSFFIRNFILLIIVYTDLQIKYTPGIKNKINITAAAILNKISLPFSDKLG